MTIDFNYAKNNLYIGDGGVSFSVIHKPEGAKKYTPFSWWACRDYMNNLLQMWYSNEAGENIPTQAKIGYFCDFHREYLAVACHTQLQVDAITAGLKHINKVEKKNKIALTTIEGVEDNVMLLNISPRWFHHMWSLSVFTGMLRIIACMKDSFPGFQHPDLIVLHPVTKLNPYPRLVGGTVAMYIVSMGFAKWCALLDNLGTLIDKKQPKTFQDCLGYHDKINIYINKEQIIQNSIHGYGGFSSTFSTPRCKTNQKLEALMQKEAA